MTPQWPQCVGDVHPQIPATPGFSACPGIGCKIGRKDLSGNLGYYFFTGMLRPFLGVAEFHA